MSDQFMETPKFAIGDDTVSVLIAVTDEMLEVITKWKHGVKAQWQYGAEDRPVSVSFGPATKEDPGLFLENDAEGLPFFRIFLPYACVAELGGHISIGEATRPTGLRRANARGPLPSPPGVVKK